ncbi:MAG: DUF2064 domain-containing protein [Parachlamydiales bacterium]
MSLGGALAIFVKTPELSPVKTRLAATIGGDKARQFYELSLLATQAMAKALQVEVPNLQIYWAVAEPEGLPSRRWDAFPALSQGAGGLGARLNFVYQELLRKHHYVCFIGADSPHLGVEDLKAGVLLTARNLREKFVLGETLDGGFYFFGGSIPVSSSSWLGVEYSTDQTADQLITKLSAFGGIEHIRKDFDVDTASDLERYATMSVANSKFLPEQKNLIRWVAGLK